jgi:hypothetical protein
MMMEEDDNIKSQVGALGEITCGGQGNVSHSMAAWGCHPNKP